MDDNMLETIESMLKEMKQLLEDILGKKRLTKSRWRKMRDEINRT